MIGAPSGDPFGRRCAAIGTPPDDDDRKLVDRCSGDRVPTVGESGVTIYALLRFELILMSLGLVTVLGYWMPLNGKPIVNGLVFVLGRQDGQGQRPALRLPATFMTRVLLVSPHDL